MVAGSSPAGRAIGCTVKQPNYGGRSSVGRAQDCDSCGRGFDPHRPPHFSDSCTACRYPASIADVVELVDTPDLGSGAARCESSSLSVRTTLLPIIFLIALKILKSRTIDKLRLFLSAFTAPTANPACPHLNKPMPQNEPEPARRLLPARPIRIRHGLPAITLPAA